MDIPFNCTIINEDDLSAIQPAEISLPLKEHQLKLLNECIKLERGITFECDQTYELNTKIGIIGDSVGSGKSMVCLAITTYPLLTTADAPANEYVDRFESKLIMITKKSISLNINIIVVPHNIFAQWKNYIEEYTNIDAEYIQTKESITNIQFNKNIVLVSAAMYKNFVSNVKCNNIHVSRVFYDEADSINISNCEKISACFYWFVTSSINNLVTPCGSAREYDDTNHRYLPKRIPGIKRKGFIKNTFTDIANLHNSIKGKLFLKNSDAIIKKSFILETPNDNVVICKNTTLLRILNNIVSADVQQMLCANDIEGAINAINIEKTDETNLIKLVTHRLYDEIDNNNIDLNAVINKHYQNKDKQEEDKLKIKNNILRLEEKIQSIKDRIKLSNIDMITLEPIQHPIILKCCTQVFDFKSITAYLSSFRNAKCPICREFITPKNMLIITDDQVDDSESDDQDDDSEAEERRLLNNDKNDNVEYILKNKIADGSKVIVFSEYDKSFEYISNIDNIKCKTLKGTINMIKKNIDWYNASSNETRVLFLNANYAGAGLNLQSTTDLIIYHKMNDELKKQVIGRANRFGRVGALNIWNMLYEDE